MSLPLDPRLQALNDDASALKTLTALNQQILSCRDPNVLPDLLGKYVALAAKKAAAPQPSPTTNPALQAYMQRLNMTQTTISNILKKTNETAANIINNMK